jgi:hypothetical protein
MKKQFFYLLLFCCSLFGACQPHDELQQQLESQLFVPYFDLIKKENYQQAYERYTSATFKRNFAFADYQKNYQKLRTDKGVLEQSTVYKVNRTVSVFGAPDQITAEISCLFGQQKYQRGLYFLISETKDGHFLIESSANNKGTYYDGYDGPW